MIGNLISFFLILVVAAIAVTIGFILSLYLKVRRAARRFTRQMGGETEQQDATRHTSGQKAQAADGEEVIAGRGVRNTGKKIIPKEEGEYVDFEEVRE